ncbi:MAG: aminoacylase [Actinobacteria bacterium]|nr:D-aminoacylase [Acidimicrobiia bacterium]PHX60009.1 MAG: aminoacylase [Actinomycetota bacterium]
MLDLLLKGGLVVDGTGSPAKLSDVGILDGRIVAIGEIDESASEVIDASDLVVTPGFVDPHTHYDAQLFWDPAAASSSKHGVTSVMAGNCGFTLAPIAAKDADYTRRMMAKVEGMPLAALESGVPWNWSTFGEYLDRLDGNIGVNAGFLVGHCALRRNVMGDEAVGNEASPSQLAEMISKLNDSIKAGGMGFSTTLSFTHSDGDGEPVASRWASRDEILALCRAVSAHEGTTLEYVTDGCLRGFSDDEIDLMAEMSLAARRPLNWNVLTIDSAEPERYREQLSALEHAASRGGRSVALTMPILVEMNMSFGTHCALFMLPDWSEVMSLPVPQRIEKLRDPQVRAHLLARSQSSDAGVFSRLADWGRYQIGDVYTPENLVFKGRQVSEIAAERGESDFDTLLDIVIADDLRTILWPLPTDDDQASWELRAEAWERDDVLLGGSDAGAHLDRMCGASYTTKFIGDCLRGKKLVSLERGVQMLTQEPAELFGLRDRGVIAEGNWADLVIFDPATIDAGDASLVEDLPGGTGRLNAESIGVKRVIVNGRSVVIDDELTGDLPGVVLRSGRDTKTVPIPADA